MANSQLRKPQLRKPEAALEPKLEPKSIESPTQPDYLEVNAAIERGLADIAAGRIHTRRSYAEYADLEIKD